MPVVQTLVAKKESVGWVSLSTGRCSKTPQSQTPAAYEAEKGDSMIRGSRWGLMAQSHLESLSPLSVRSYRVTSDQSLGCSFRDFICK